ncbi:urea amidolyase associated protein UAAP1 [Halobacillus massiliensis]|uniref:urea amidolyase associated protein UAAP1 n=1 Tax=Halobacillus massiliensis TaxID=1926286 RepID=UPI0009E39F72|nr:urea amidolyase associated protein UAAP1 [Halobacillus massiliensis]
MGNLWTRTLRAGAKWSGSISRGKQIKITALEEGANLSCLFFNERNRSEKYNMPDTLKAQHTSHLTKGNILMSDNGQAMVSILEDDLGWHDPIGGYTTRQLTDEKYGKTTYQQIQNEWYRSGQENFAMELVRNGLESRDMGPVVNLFSKIFVDESGDMHFVEGHSKKGDSVTLRTEMDVLLLLSNTPNPFDPTAAFSKASVKVEVLPAAPVRGDDYCLNYHPENKRAFENTWDYYSLVSQ